MKRLNPTSFSPEASRGATWEEFRAEMPIAERWAYFDHAAVAPLSGPAQQAMQAWSVEAVEQGDTVWPQWAAGIEQTRRAAASLINAQLEEIAFVPNTTAGISLVAEGFPWQPSDNVITIAGEFPSNLYPWMNLASRGVEVRQVELEDGGVNLDGILRLCDKRTRLIAVSWVGYASGWRVDVGQLVALAHARHILVLLDAIQGLGVFPINVRKCNVDFLAADGHKWLLGPEGAGILFIRRDRLDRLRPTNVGWNSVQQAHDFDQIELNLRDSAARFEGGSPNTAGLLGLGASLGLLQRFGAGPDGSPVADRIRELCEVIASSLEEMGGRVCSPRDAKHGSGIVSCELPGRDLATVRRQCRAAGVALSVRGGRLRVSPHAYVNQRDIERLIEALR